MPLVRNTTTGNNYLVKMNTDGDTCSRTAIRSYNKQLGSQGSSGRTRFTLPFSFDPGSHTLWVFINGEKAVVETSPINNRQYSEVSDRVVQLGGAVGATDVLEFIVAGSYLNEDGIPLGSGSGFTWILTADNNLALQNLYGYMADTRTTTLTFVLPASPVEGDTFAVVDAFGTFGTHNVVLNRNGKDVAGLAQNYVFAVNGTAAQFVYDGINNWVIAFGASSGIEGATKPTVTTIVPLRGNILGGNMVRTSNSQITIDPISCMDSTDTIALYRNTSFVLNIPVSLTDHLYHIFAVRLRSDGSVIFKAYTTEAGATNDTSIDAYRWRAFWSTNPSGICYPGRLFGNWLAFGGVANLSGGPSGGEIPPFYDADAGIYVASYSIFGSGITGAHRHDYPDISSIVPLNRIYKLVPYCNGWLTGGVNGYSSVAIKDSIAPHEYGDMMIGTQLHSFVSAYYESTMNTSVFIKAVEIIA